jgi:DEAD/DEAH box helicase domain-containing protein
LDKLRESDDYYPVMRGAIMNQERRIVFLDVETQRTFQEVGGRHCLSSLGLATAVTYDSVSGEYRSYAEDEVEELVEVLAGADLVVGFNVKSFDYEVLRPYTDYPLHTIPTADMLQDIYRELGFRLSLDSVAQATLGIGKSADGLQAVRWFREGELDKVIEYCQRDVEVTRRLYEYGCEKGYILYWDRRGLMQKIFVNWS